MNFINKKIRVLSTLLEKIIVQLRTWFFLLRVKNQKLSNSRVLYPNSHKNLESEWIYHSEKWSKVINRGKDRQMLKRGRSLTQIDNKEEAGNDVLIKNGKLKVKTRINGEEKWVYLYLNPSEHIWRNIEWKFKVKRLTNFRELQFGFRYRDFYNRYRFRHEKGRIYFDKVLNGQFYNNICSEEFSMELGREYDFKIICSNYYFSIIIDGVKILDACDYEKKFNEGSIAIILWEDDGETPIQVTITDQQVNELISES